MKEILFVLLNFIPKSKKAYPNSDNSNKHIIITMYQVHSTLCVLIHLILIIFLFTRWMKKSREPLYNLPKDTGLLSKN